MEKNNIYRAGKSFDRAVLFGGLSCFCLCLVFALAYLYLLDTSKPTAYKLPDFYRIVATGLLFGAVIVGFGRLYKDFIRYEITDSSLRISKGRFLRIIPLEAIMGIDEKFSKSGKLKSLSLRLPGGGVIAINLFVEDLASFEDNLRKKRHI